MTPQLKLRIARPTDHWDALLRFYRDGLGLELLGAFEDHDGFDGMMLGAPDAPYHFEFTRQKGHTVGPAPARPSRTPTATGWSYKTPSGRVKLCIAARMML